ncbi:uncharacterized protein LOC126751947 [Bactrocera neohumeralis]|uniref:uncharacterized protein LOC126751947 n=1 Tax=Bactrocera neohumeralis TaxID=98809 RepID=UPI0021660AF1|nr:uncharacterized protein LOC126751947 [Bactrocera neohumeralis]
MLTDFQELWPTSRKSALPKSNELQSINVGKTCDKLRLAITQASNDLQRTQDISHRRSGEELSFRSISRLCYTTLRIHELQVDDLLNKSKELVTQSKNWCTVQAKKRSLPTHYSTYNAKRKRRATVEHSFQDFTITNFTELLDETAKFVEWGKTTEIVNKKVSKTKSHSRTTCIHIREITINEFESHNEQYSYDEDDGFGNTTDDGLATIIQLLGDEPTKAPKRKAADALAVCEKKPRNNDAPQEGIEIPEIETARSAVVEHETSSLFIPAQTNVNDSNVNELSPVRTELCVMPATDCSVVFENNDNYVEVPESANLDNITSIPNETTKVCNYHKESVTPNEPLKKLKSKQSKTIIDACTALTQSEMRAQIQTQINIKAKLRKIRAKVKWNNGRSFNGRKHYEKLLPSAKDLLTTLQYNCFAYRKFKLKNKTRRSNLEVTTAGVTYRNLLRDILNWEITDDLATQVYTKWNHTEKRNLRTMNNLTNYRPLENAEMLQQDTRYNESSLLPQSTMEVDVFNNNNNNLQYPNGNCSPSYEQDEWGAYDVMIKLLNMWRSQIVLDDEISVKLLFPQIAMSRKAAAKAFGALLRLAANGFIMLFTAEHTKHLRCIKLGAASNKLIEGIELNNEIVSRRSNNGLRIIAG